MDAMAESGRKPVSKSNIFSLDVENEQADGGRDGRTCIARTNYTPEGANGDRKKKTIFPVQLTTSRTSNLTRLIHTLLKVVAIDASRCARSASLHFDFLVLTCTWVVSSGSHFPKLCRHENLSNMSQGLSELGNCS